jgi:hypothetical protein
MVISMHRRNQLEVQRTMASEVALGSRKTVIRSLCCIVVVGLYTEAETLSRTDYVCDWDMTCARGENDVILTNPTTQASSECYNIINEFVSLIIDRFQLEACAANRSVIGRPRTYYS